MLPPRSPAVVRSERVSQKVESLLTRVPYARLLFVESQSQPPHHSTRPLQCLRRFSTAEDHEVIRVIHDARPPLLPTSGLPPSLQHPVHVEIREQRAADSQNAKDNFEFDRRMRFLRKSRAH